MAVSVESLPVNTSKCESVVGIDRKLFGSEYEF